MSWILLENPPGISWKSDHVSLCQVMVQDIVFPLMCHSDEDEELWDSDPVEYIRVKYGLYTTM